MRRVAFIIIKERWHAEEGPVEITFVHRGEPVEIRPNYLDDYIDIDILGAINSLIQDTGIQFEVYRIFDQSAFVVALTAEEKKKLERERGWQFMQMGTGEPLFTTRTERLQHEQGQHHQRELDKLAAWNAASRETQEYMRKQVSRKVDHP